MSSRICDHTSVGMIVRNGEDILLIERRKPPYGFAAPAGHVDGDPSFDVAAWRELEEEVGLKGTSLSLVIDLNKTNPCRRPDGTWHHWKVYEISAEGNFTRSLSETKQVGWYSPEQILKLGARTLAYLNKDISDSDWQESPGLEPIWYEHFKYLGIMEKI